MAGREENGKVNVVINLRLPEGHVERIAAVSPRVVVHNPFEAYRREFQKQMGRKVEEGPEAEKLQNEYDGLLAEADALYVIAMLKDLNARTPKLKWLHLGTAGFDYLFGSGFLERGISITNSSGVAAIPVSERALEMIMSLAKERRALVKQQEEKAWKRMNPAELYGATVGIISLGRIGSEIAKRAKAFGMRVIGTRRTAAGEKAENVEQVYPISRLNDLLAESDYVVLTLPSTAETKKLIGEAQLKAMKKSAFLINVARGDVVDEQALIAALRDGTIAGAALDVFDKEPLPADSAFWELPNVLISPHVAGYAEKGDDRMTDLFCDNLRLFLDGKPLVNIVDATKGY